MVPAHPGARSPAARTTAVPTVTGVLDLLFPPRCVGCGTPAVPLCAACAAALDPAVERDPPPGLDRVWSLVDYDGVGRDLVISLKYDGRRDAVRLLGAAMGGLPEGPFDALTWAPTSPSRRRARGFDQAELLARQVGRILRLRPRRLLERPEGRAQTGHDRSDRLAGPHFTARGTAPRRVLVVDDVMTTGSTLAAAAATLRAAGAIEVCGVTLASVR